MAAIVWSDVTSVIPEMTAVTNVLAQTLALGIANTWWAVDEFDGEESALLKTMRILMAAHIALRFKPGTSGAAGPVIAESGGGLSVTYASALSSANNLSSTEYGRTINELRATRACRAWVVL